MSALALAALLLVTTPASTQAAPMPMASGPGTPERVASLTSLPDAPSVSRWQTVAYGDLDLATVSGAETLTTRINRAAYRTCAELHGRSIAGRSDCQAEFRNKALAALPDEALQDYASSSRTTVEF